MANITIDGRYQLLKILTTSQTADIWDAFDIRLSRPVAIKLMSTESIKDPLALVRFRNEANVGARLVHRHIVETFDAGTAKVGSDSLPFLVMERIYGETLRQEINKGPAAEDDIRKVGTEIASALEFAHENGFLHGDVKPTNILLSVEQDSVIKRALLGDFGLTAKIGEPSIDESTVVGGTATYAAPEMLRGTRPSAQNDIYSLGVVLYEMATGTPPFVGSSEREVVDKKIQADSPLVEKTRPQLSTPLAQVINKAMAADPAERYQTAKDLRAALIFVAHDQDISREAQSATPRSNKKVEKATRNRKPYIIIGSLILFVFALFLVVLKLGGFDSIIAKKPNPTVQIAVRSVAAFDPQGDDQENDGLLVNLIDQDPNSLWTSQRYNSTRFGGLKDGVGVIFEIDSAEVSKVLLQAVSDGTQMELYASDKSPVSLTGWGKPVASSATQGNALTFNPIKPADASYLLLWVTDLGPQKRASFGGIVVTGKDR